MTTPASPTIHIVCGLAKSNPEITPPETKVISSGTGRPNPHKIKMPNTAK